MFNSGTGGAIVVGIEHEVGFAVSAGSAHADRVSTALRLRAAADDIEDESGAWKDYLRVALSKGGDLGEALDYLEKTKHGLGPYLGRFPELRIAIREFGAACADVQNCASAVHEVAKSGFTAHLRKAHPHALGASRSGPNRYGISPR